MVKYDKIERLRYQPALSVGEGRGGAFGVESMPPGRRACLR